MESFATRLCLTAAEANELHGLLVQDASPTLVLARKRLELWQKREAKSKKEQDACPQLFKLGDRVFIKYNKNLQRQGQVGTIETIAWLSWCKDWYYYVKFRDGFCFPHRTAEIEKDIK